MLSAAIYGTIGYCLMSLLSGGAAFYAMWAHEYLDYQEVVGSLGVNEDPERASILGQYKQTQPVSHLPATSAGRL